MSSDIWSLIKACSNNNLRLVKTLVENGADVNEETEYFCNTPLMAACGSTSYRVAEYLISKGALVNKANRDGVTALTWALRGDIDEEAHMYKIVENSPNHRETISLLLMEGADTSIVPLPHQGFEWPAYYERKYKMDFDSMKAEAIFKKHKRNRMESLNPIFLCFLKVCDENEEIERLKKREAMLPKGDEKNEINVQTSRTFLQDLNKNVHNVDVFFTELIFPLLYSLYDEEDE